MKKLIIFLVAFFIVLLVVLGRDSYEQSYRVPIEILRDPGGELTLDEILTSPLVSSFTTVPGEGHTAGYTDDALWFRFELKPFDSAIPQMFLEIQPANLDDIELYVPDKNDGFQTFLAGDIHPFSERMIPYRAPVISLTNPQAPLTSYIRLKTSGSSAIFLTAWTPVEFYQASLLEYALIGLYVGILLMFIFANIYRAEWTTQSGLHYFVIFVASLMMVALSTGGMFGQYLWPDQPWLNQIIPPAITISMLAASTMYYGHLFGADNADSDLMRNVRSGMYTLVATGYISVLLGYYVLFAPFLLIISAVVGVWLALRSARLLKVNSDEAKWLISGFLFSFSGFLITALSTMGIISGSFASLNAYYFTTIITVGNYQILMNLRVARLENVQRQALFEAIYLQKRLASEQQISEFQTRFLAMIHHELRTPLSVIRLALGMKNASPKVKSHAIEAVRNIDIILERCSLSQRLDHAPISPNIKEVEIYSFIENALTKMSGQHRLKLNESHDMSGYVVKTDPDLLRILLSNVIENALKYAVEESMIDIAVTRSFEFFECCITISNRIEHPEEIDISKIFERYVRTASAAKHSGSGLGLYIAKGLAESLNGEITCTVDKGIIHFEICL